MQPINCTWSFDLESQRGQSTGFRFRHQLEIQSDEHDTVCAPERAVNADGDVRFLVFRHPGKLGFCRVLSFQEMNIITNFSLQYAFGCVMQA